MENPAEAPATEGRHDAEVSVTPAADTQLAEVEQLLQALETQPREIEPPGSREVPQTLSNEPPGSSPDEEEEKPELHHELRSRPARHRSRRHGTRRRRRAIRWTIYAVLFVLIIAGGGLGGSYGYRHFLKPVMGKPEALLQEARVLSGKGRFADAADRFLLYAERVPDGLARPDALFNAACALQRTEGAGTATERQARLHRALAVFEQFIKDYPDHVKRRRAEILSGVVLMELDEYDRATEVLRDALARAEDKLSQLPILRTLARVHAQAGQYEQAESMYLQAAVLSQNLTPEVDYDELGQLFHALARMAPNETERQARLEKAVEYLTRAAETRGISPDYRDDLKERIAMLKEPIAPSRDPAGKTTAPGANEAPGMGAGYGGKTNPAKETQPPETPVQ